MSAVCDHNDEPAPDALADGELEELVSGALQARDADGRLARQLGRPGPRGTAPSGSYLAALASRRPLTPEQERRLVMAAKAGDAQARARLIESLLPQLAAMTRLYRQTPQIERVELIQEGVVGLLRALQRYDPQRGVPFWSFAAWWVRQAMQQLVAELTRPMILSDRALRALARIRDAQRALSSRGGGAPSVEQIARHTRLAPELVGSLLALDRPPRSLQEPIEDAEGQPVTLGEAVSDPASEAGYEQVLDAIEAQELLALLSGLSERERMILRARFGLDGEEQTLSEIGSRLGVSAERVRQLERRALAKLRAAAQEPQGGPSAGSKPRNSVRGPASARRLEDVQRRGQART